MRRLLAALSACVLLAACSGERDPGEQPERSSVDVDTAPLRALKAKAGVEPCVPGTSSSELPSVTLPCLGGGKDVDLTRLRGPMVVNLFAQWCGPCRAELPYYQELHEKASGKVRVLGVDYLDTQPSQALRLVQQAGVTFPLLADPSGLLRPEFKVRGLPVIVLVDAEGKVTDVEFRAFRSYTELRDLVEQQLGVALPA